LKIKLLVGILVFLIVVNLATIGSFVYMRWSHRDAPPPGYFDHRGFDHRRGPWADRDARMRFPREDRQELMGLLRELRDETQDLRDRIDELEGQTLRVLQQDPVPRAQLDSLLEDIAATQLLISRKATDKLIEAKIHLSPEQQKMFFEAIRTVRPGRPGPRRQLHGSKRRAGNRRFAPPDSQ
jgi:uncharacterized membrane protein